MVKRFINDSSVHKRKNNRQILHCNTTFLPATRWYLDVLKLIHTDFSALKKDRYNLDCLRNKFSLDIYLFLVIFPQVGTLRRFSISERRRDKGRVTCHECFNTALCPLAALPFRRLLLLLVKKTVESWINVRLHSQIDCLAWYQLCSCDFGKWRRNENYLIVAKS